MEQSCFVVILEIVILWALLFLSLRYPWWFPRKWRSLPVIMYHHIGQPVFSDPPTPKQLHEELTFLNEAVFTAQLTKIKEMGFTFINLADLAQPLPPKPIMLTFDDGHRDNFTKALPILERLQAKATIFLATDYIDHDPTYLTWEQVKIMDQSPLITFGSHSFSHTRLRQLSPEEIKHELTHSKKVIEEHLGHPINAFAYPYGSGAYRSKIRAQVLAAGYQYDFSTRPGRASLPLSSKRPITRLSILRHQPPRDFMAQIRWGHKSIL